jgi:hypothetical protein
VDAEYVRKGVAQIFLEVERLTGKRHVAATEHKPRKDWAWWIKGMLDERYPNAIRVRLIVITLIHTALHPYMRRLNLKRPEDWQDELKFTTHLSTAVSSTWQRSNLAL